MLLNLFSVFDSKVGFYMSPFFMRSKGEAIRAFIDIVNDGKSAFSMHPEDYTLFHLGTFDECTGEVTSGVAESLGNGINFYRSSEPA